MMSPSCTTYSFPSLASFPAARQAASLRSLLNAEEVELSTESFDAAARGAAPAQPAGLGVICLPLAGLVDVAAERAKLEKQQKELNGWIAGSRAKLSNERFLANAPAEVVASAKTHLAELEAKLERVQSLLANLQ